MTKEIKNLLNNSTNLVVSFKTNRTFQTERKYRIAWANPKSYQNTASQTYPSEQINPSRNMVDSKLKFYLISHFMSKYHIHSKVIILAFIPNMVLWFYKFMVWFWFQPQFKSWIPWPSQFPKYLTHPKWT